MTPVVLLLMIVALCGAGAGGYAVGSRTRSPRRLESQDRKELDRLRNLKNRLFGLSATNAQFDTFAAIVLDEINKSDEEGKELK